MGRLPVRSAGYSAVSESVRALTDSESAEYPALLTGRFSPHAASRSRDALRAAKGYRVSRRGPEWLTAPRARNLLKASGFPPGVVRTTTGETGALGAFATTFKADKSRSSQGTVTPSVGVREPADDADAFETAKNQPARPSRVPAGTTAPAAAPHRGLQRGDHPTISALPATCR